VRLRLAARARHVRRGGELPIVEAARHHLTQPVVHAVLLQERVHAPRGQHASAAAAPPRVRVSQPKQCRTASGPRAARRARCGVLAGLDAMRRQTRSVRHRRIFESQGWNARRCHAAFSNVFSIGAHRDPPRGLLSSAAKRARPPARGWAGGARYGKPSVSVRVMTLSLVAVASSN